MSLAEISKANGLAGKILVTGFVPFGLIRGHAPLVKGNRSQRILELLRARYGMQDFEYFVLPVDQTAVGTLEQHLTPSIIGLFMMGEDLLAGVRIETTSYDPRRQIGLGPVQFRLPGATSALSPFAERLADETEGTRGVSTRSDIGTFYCNRVYWRGQEWGRSTGHPTVFIHVGPFQSIGIQFERITHMLKQMLAAARANQTV